MQSLIKPYSLPCSHQIPLPKAVPSASLPPTCSPDGPCKPLQELEDWLFAFCTVCSVANYHCLGLWCFLRAAETALAGTQLQAVKFKTGHGGEGKWWNLDLPMSIGWLSAASRRKQGKKGRDVLETYCFFVCPLQHSRSHHLLMILLTVSLAT